MNKCLLENDLELDFQELDEALAFPEQLGFTLPDSDPSELLRREAE